MTKQTVQDLCEFCESYAATEQRKKLQQWEDVKNYLFLSNSLSHAHNPQQQNPIFFSILFFFHFSPALSTPNPNPPNFLKSLLLSCPNF